MSRGLDKTRGEGSIVDGLFSFVNVYIVSILVRSWDYGMDS